MGFDVRKNLWKGVVSFLKTSAGLALPVLLAFWTDPENVQKLFSEIDMVKWAPVVTAIISMLMNYGKNKNK